MTKPDMLSTPALVLTIGASLLPAVVEAERIFLQSDVRRRATTRFLAVNQPTRKSEMIWMSSAEAMPMKRISTTWREAYDQTRDQAEIIKAGLESALHELRSHERLIEVGLGGKPHLPLDVFVLADLAENDAAALLTVLPVLQAQLTDEPYTSMHVLLKIAAFGDDPETEANVFVTMKHLQQWLQADQNSTVPQTYLFDRFKEGVWEAQDDAEVQTIMGNFLLALLSGGLAQQISHQLPHMEVEQHQAYFCGASAAAILLDVGQLQQACVLRLGREIIEHEFHSRVDPNPGAIEEVASDFLANQASLQVWMNQLCRDTLFHAMAGGRGLELHASDLQFEGLPLEGWVSHIQAYDEKFKSTRLPIQNATVNKNAVVLNREFLKQITMLAQALPQHPRLYPGGVRAARLVLEYIRRALLELSPGFRPEAEVEQEWCEPVTTSLEWLGTAIAKLPKPPRWVLRLPGFLKKPAIQLFNLVFLHRELQTITDLREASLRLLEKKYAALMEARLGQALAELNRGWIAALDKHIRSVKRLQSLMDKLHDRLGDRSNELVSASSLFRLSALNETILAWAYYNGKRPQAGFRQALLTEHAFLKDWQGKKYKLFEESLLKFCREIYHPLTDMDLEEVLSHRNGQDASDLAAVLSQGAIPLLRPNFDQMGAGPSYQMRFFQSRDPKTSAVLPILKEDMQDWMEISTQDPFLMICSRVRVMIPGMALSQVFERGCAAYESLSEDWKAGLSLPEAP